ncbi:MAG: glycogen synthase, partial [Clostridia bacterium]
DVIGALPKALAKNKNYDIRVVMPKYSVIPAKYMEKMQYMGYFYTDLNWRHKYCGVFQLIEDNVTYYFLDSEYYFNGQMYCFADLERFSFFSKACLDLLSFLDFKVDVIHANDWSSALVPVYLSTYRHSQLYKDIKTIFTIHNLKYQGRYPIEEVKDITGLHSSFFTSDKLEFYGEANLLKGGICYADKVTTVSPTYAKEIMTPSYGEGLDQLLSARDTSGDVVGILNGLDYTRNSPAKDTLITKKYNIKSMENGKALCKKALQERLHLPIDKDVALVGVVSRMVDQKGFDLIGEVLEQMVQRNVQLVFLGTGEKRYEDMFRWYADKYPSKVSACITFSNELSHAIYSASDIFLMPSIYEPCGLSQLIAMKYGSIPVVRETGGLKDTVISLNEETNEGSGFTFARVDAIDMLYTFDRALRIYYDKKDSFIAMQKRDMALNYSWNRSRAEYVRLYRSIIPKRKK